MSKFSRERGQRNSLPAARKWIQYKIFWRTAIGWQVSKRIYKGCWTEKKTIRAILGQGYEIFFVQCAG